MRAIMKRACVAALTGSWPARQRSPITRSQSSSTTTGIVSVQGVVTEFKFPNPHGVIRVNVTGKDGKVEEWRAETNSPSILERRGWKKTP